MPHQGPLDRATVGFVVVRESELTTFSRNGEQVIRHFLVIWLSDVGVIPVITYFHLYVDILQVMEADEGVAWYTSGLQHSVYSD